MSDPDDKPRKPAEEALERARKSLDQIGDDVPENAREEVAETDPDEAPLADAESAPEPAYVKEPETAPVTVRPARSAADVARAIDGEGDAPAELSVFAREYDSTPPAPAPQGADDAAEMPVLLGDTMSPVDLPEPAIPLPNPLRWMTVTIAVATLFLAVFNAQTIRAWAYELPPTPANARIVSLSESWFDLTASLGLDRPFATLRSWYHGAKEARFGDEGGANHTAPEGE